MGDDTMGLMMYEALERDLFLLYAGIQDDWP